MNMLRWIISGCLLLCCLAPTAKAGDQEDLARRIDAHLARKWDDAGARPAASSTDAEFVRRIYLDLIGRIPYPAETEKFLDDKRPDKRAQLIDHLLTHPRYVAWFTRVWRGILLPEAELDPQARFQASGLDAWLSERIGVNTPYDVMVRELLTAPVGNDRNPFITPGRASPVGYYLAREALPENMADAVARQFLGVRLGCAQCHNHPFAQWKREQFWEFAAFFTGLRGATDRVQLVRPDVDRAQLHEIRIPNTDKKVQARFLDGTQPNWQKNSKAREVLAAWMTDPKNPYFARAAVNRLWFQFFGTGLVDPVDDMAGGESFASHPELLDELAREFIAHKYDLKYLIGALTRTQAYQLSSKRSHASQDDPRLFARAPLRGLTPEQLFDSLVVSTGFQENDSPQNQRAFFAGVGNTRAEFLARFHNTSDKPTETQTSILQALTLMNGRLTAEATHLVNSKSLAALLDLPGIDGETRIERLYLLTLARKPSAKELRRSLDFINEAIAAGDADKSTRYNNALADIFWALLNSSEYFLNH